MSSSTSESDETAAADACAEFQGVVTPEQSAATPRTNLAGETTGLFFTDEPVVPLDVFERAYDDFIVMNDEGYNGCSAGLPKTNEIFLTFDADHRGSVDAGTYDAWDCVNALYEASLQISGDGSQAIVHLGGIFDTAQILPDYAALPGVVAQTVQNSCTSDFPSWPSPTKYGCAEGTTWHYWWAVDYEGQTDVPNTGGAHLVSEPGEPPVVTCSWEDGEAPCPMPGCLEIPD